MNATEQKVYRSKIQALEQRVADVEIILMSMDARVATVVADINTELQAARLDRMDAIARESHERIEQIEQVQRTNNELIMWRAGDFWQRLCWLFLGVSHGKTKNSVDVTGQDHRLRGSLDT